MKLETNEIRIDPLKYFMYYHDLEVMEEFEIEHMADSPYHFNYCMSLCDKDDEIRDSLLVTMFREPNRVKKIIPTKEYTLMLTDEQYECIKKL